MSYHDHGAHQFDVSVLNRLKLAAKVTMYMLGGNIKEIFELLINKLVFSEPVLQRLNWLSGHAFRKKCILDYIMKEFLYWIWIISFFHLCKENIS